MGFDPVTLALAKKYSDSKGGYVENSAITYDGNGEKIDLLGDGRTFAKISNDDMDLTGVKTVTIYLSQYNEYKDISVTHISEGIATGLVGADDGTVLVLSAPHGNELGLEPGVYVTDTLSASGYQTYVARFQFETIHPIDPKYLPGVCLPVVEIADISALTDAENAALSACIGMPCVLKCTVQGIPMACVAHYEYADGAYLLLVQSTDGSGSFWGFMSVDGVTWMAAG